jgi:hypothetical protein
MLPNQNLCVHNTFTLGSPPPTLTCPHCPRHFCSTGGRTKHIRAKYQTDGSSPPDPNPSVPPPFVQSLSQLSPGPSSPIPSDFESTMPPIHGGFNHPNWDSNWDVEQPYSDLGYAPPGSDSDAVNEDPPPASSQHIPIPPSITHPSIYYSSLHLLLMLTIPSSMVSWSLLNICRY